MTYTRFAMFGLASYNIGAEATRAVLSVLLVWGIVEFAVAFHARRQARRRAWRHEPVVLRPFDRDW